MKIKDLILKTDNSTFDSAVNSIIKNIKNKKKTFVITLNPEIIMIAKNDSIYENAINSSDLVLPDGVGVIWAGKIFGKKFKDRANGVELIEAICRSSMANNLSIGFLGGKGKTAHIVSEKMKSKFSGLKVSFAEEEPGDIKDFKCDVLFVAFGSPKQELWIKNNLNKDFMVGVGVGGAFDFIAGNVKRAPRMVRELGMEWFFRLIIEPWRVKRQVRLPLFVISVLKEKLS